MFFNEMRQEFYDEKWWIAPIIILTDQDFFVKVIRQSIFHEGVVRVIGRRDLSTDSAMTCHIE